jgi:hypothetical protein
MRILWRVLAAVVLIGAIIGIGVFAYNIGVGQGLAQKIPIPTGQPAQIPYFYYGHPFGFGFGFLGCLVPLFLLFLVFGSMRALFWHGPMMGWRHMHGRRWGWHDPEDKGVPPFFEEWHRRAHGNPEEKPDEK